MIVNRSGVAVSGYNHCRKIIRYPNVKLKVLFRVLILSLALAVFNSCGTRTMGTREAKGLNDIYRVRDFDLSSPDLIPFKDVIEKMNPSHISVANDTVRIFFPDRALFYELTIGKNNQILVSPPKRFDRNHYLYFSALKTPTPTATPTARKQVTKRVPSSSGKKSPVTISVNAQPTTPSPTPQPTVWTKDRIAMEILKGNSPRDQRGNIVHTATGEETLADIVEWYTGDLKNLDRISHENGIQATDAPIARGVKVTVPAELVRNPKRFQKK